MRVLVALILLLVARESPEPDEQVSGDDSSPAEGEAPVWGRERAIDPDPSLEIGTVSGGGPTMLADVGSAAFSSGGRIAVGDSRADRIQVFDSLGDHVATSGRPGEGPGEFADLGRVYDHLGDSVAAFDFGLARTLVFPLDGGDSRAISGLCEDQRAPVLGVLASGALLSYQRMRTTARPPAIMWDSLRMVLVPPDGTGVRHVGTVGFAPAPPPGSPPPLLAPRSVMAAAADGFYWARTDRYEILRFDTLGAQVGVIRRSVEPLELTAADARQYREGLLARARETGGERAEQALARQMGDGPFAQTRPLFGSAFVDEDERLWISDLPWPSRFDPPGSPSDGRRGSLEDRRPITQPRESGGSESRPRPPLRRVSRPPCPG